ncbi:MAG TPA: phosphocholine cytidylyltransferase family protein [Gammaproteobacteria bacterium]|nr:phosphocholine cytidylyltransferase family protein [Gammaproteobacteria bacterium]
MKTIILAAGIGQRLGEVPGDRPKCLLEFGGTSLLQRHLDILSHYGLTDIIIVTGYQAAMIDDSVRQSGYVSRVRTVHNAQYSDGSLISMLSGLRSLENDEDLLLMDADVLYDHRMVQRLLDSSHDNCFLLDREFEPGDEPVKLCVLDDCLVEFRKKIDDNLKFDLQGESVGFFRFNRETATQLVASAEKYLSQGMDQQPYEECIRDILLDNPSRFGYEDVTGLPWIEIDFPDDVIRAEQEILPRITRIS